MPAGTNARKMRQYWRMPSSADRRTTVADLRDELANTVKMQLVADVPLGVFLSGGVDSSAVAALASEVAPGAVHTFTIGFDVAAYDETRYARQVADAIKSHHTSVDAHRAELPGAAARRLHGHRPAHLRRHQHLLREPCRPRRRA